jgi:hypothetical protein
MAAQQAKSRDCAAELRTDGEFSRVLRSLKRVDWIVYARRPFGSPEHVLKYLARYTHRVALASGRLVCCEDGNYVFAGADGHRFIMTCIMAGNVLIPPLRRATTRLEQSQSRCVAFREASLLRSRYRCATEIIASRW